MWLLRDFLTLIFMLSLVFLAACDGTKTTPGTDALTDGIAADDDLITDDLIPDEEEPDEADIDTKTDTKPDPDKVEADTVDIDEVTDETPDDDGLITGPCDPNPCDGMTGSTGECTVDEETFICGCAANYTWDAEEKVCMADTRRTDCVNIPASAHGTGDNADGKFEQTWDGENWLPGSVVCTWACDTNYTMNEEETGCLADTQRVDCVNIPPNAHGIAANADGKFTQTWSGANQDWLPETFACAWVCDTNYTVNGDETACVANTQRVACINALPDNASWSGDNADGKFTQTWSGIDNDWMPVTFDCLWTCNENYSLNEDENGCVADTQRVACANTLPENAQWSGDNDDGKFEQTWNGEFWLPISFSCTWECNEHYTANDTQTLCVADTQKADCVNIPPNAHGVDPNADGKFTQTWDGGDWAPGAEEVECAWECDEHYTKNGLVCDADTQRVDCANILANAHGTGDNVDGKFEQTWDGNDWAPATFVCEWACDYQYQYRWDEWGELCELRPIVYVNHAATDGENTGYSWADAFTDLQDALKQVIAGQEIWVATGTYKPSRCPYFDGCDDKEKTFMMFRDTGVDFVLYGGFDGTETTRDQRDWETNETILSGDIDGDDAWDDINKEWLNRDDNVYRVATFDPAYPVNTLLLDGFTFSGGHAAGPGNRGGALSSTNHAVTIRNSYFIGNFSLDGGGALFVIDGSLTVEDSAFYRNAVGDDSSGGGAIGVLASSLTVSGSVFEENRAGDAGGAISFGNGDDITVTDSSFLGNGSNGTAAAIAIGNATAVTITGSDFIGNIGVFGGAIEINQSASAIFNSCYFEANEATDANGDGGAIRVNAETFSLSDSQFVDNSAASHAALSLWSVVAATITSSDFTGNDGGAIYANESALTIDDATFIGNTGTRYSAISISNASSLSMTDSLFQSNDAGNNVVIEDSLSFSMSRCSFLANNGTISSNGNTPMDIVACDFIGNHAGTGGAINAGGGNIVIRDSRFKDNAADLPPLPGNEIFAGWGGALGIMGGNLLIVNSIFDGNTASQLGGAMVAIMTAPHIVNCTFDGNTDINGDGIVFIAANGSVDNTVLWDTVKEVTSITVGSDVYELGPSNPTFSYSDVYGSGGSGNDCGPSADEYCWVLPFGTDGGGNIDADPLFVSVGTDPLDLKDSSPCVNAGSNVLVPEGILYDILGDARIQAGPAGVVDMGAYEQ